MAGKTLKELNVQVGDVVARDGYSDKVGYAITLSEIETDKRNGFRIVRRARYTKWGDMTPTEKGELLLAIHEGNRVEEMHFHGDYANSWLEWSPQPLKMKDDIAYRIKVKPKRSNGVVYYADTHRITFTTIDGIPDCASVKMDVL